MTHTTQFIPTKGTKIIFKEDSKIFDRRVYKGQKGEITSIYDEGDEFCTVRPENHVKPIIGVPIAILEEDRNLEPSVP